MKYALPLLALVLAAGQVAAAEPLGRLFFTPAQRAQLDSARSQKDRMPPAPEQEAAAPLPEVVTYGGIVRRSDGRTTVWINDRALDDAKAAERLPLPGRVRSDGSVNLELPQANRSVNLKVGQSVEIVSGTIEEPYARGPVRSRSRSKPAAAADDRSASKVENAVMRSPGMRKDEDAIDQDRR